MKEAHICNTNVGECQTYIVLYHVYIHRAITYCRYYISIYMLVHRVDANKTQYVSLKDGRQEKE